MGLAVERVWGETTNGLCLNNDCLQTVYSLAAHVCGCSFFVSVVVEKITLFFTRSGTRWFGSQCLDSDWPYVEFEVQHPILRSSYLMESEHLLFQTVQLALIDF